MQLKYGNIPLDRQRKLRGQRMQEHAIKGPELIGLLTAMLSISHGAPPSHIGETYATIDSCEEALLVHGGPKFGISSIHLH